MEKIKKFLVWWSTFFSEEEGASTVRFLNWLWMLTLCANVTFITVFNAAKTGVASLPPMESLSGYVALTGLLLSAKVGQRVWGENPVTGK
jgi:hypothetical protein